MAFDLTGNGEDAEDLSQEIFIKMFRSLKDFRGESKLSSWLYRITVNTWIDMKRTRIFKLRSLEEPFEEENLGDYGVTGELIGGNPEKNAEASIMRKHLQWALKKLSPRERSVFVLRHYNDMRMIEIGETLNISVGSVKSHLFRAIKKLQKSLAFLKHE